MRKLILFWLLSLAVVGGLASALTFAQPRSPLAIDPLANAPILSGADIGFRLEGTNRSGEPIGTLMVRINGEWMAASSVPTWRPAK
jgi:hypothetical protein